MTTSPNPARAGLANGDTVLGFGVRLTRTIEVVNLVAACGYDWLFIDLEHAPTSVETAADLCTAALAAGIAPLARMSEADYSTAARMLDAGAWGILMPHIERAADAREMVKRLKFPPHGHRSVSYSMPQLGFKAMNQAEAVQRFNDEMLLVAMIESAEAVTHADEIAAVSGIDALFVGTNDLAMDLGIPGDVGHPKITAAYENVIAACQRHHKWPGMGGVYGEEALRRYIGMGMKLVLGGTDMALLLDSATQRAELIRKLVSSGQNNPGKITKGKSKRAKEDIRGRL